MEGELFNLFYRLAHQHAAPRLKRQQYTDAIIVLIFLWAVLNDRPIGWACQRRNRPFGWRGPLPSNACISRRMRTVSAQLLLKQLIDQLNQLQQVAGLLLLIFDSKPLIVGAFSKDRHARWGYLGEGKKARGYRLHLVQNAQGQVLAWTVASMNEADSIVARRLIPQLHTQGYLLGDSAYDSNALHALCAEHRLRLLAPRKKPQTGMGHHRHQADRLQALALLESPEGTVSAFARELYQQRGQIERLFGRWSSCAAGLSLSLPAWVRGPRRVALWIAGKLAILLAIQSHRRPPTNKDLPR